MKIRTGFVSNSSSSSFVCDVCGNIESGWDFTLAEAGFLECQYGHIMCEQHIEEGKRNEKVTDQWGDILLNSDFCPMCTLEQVSDRNIVDYFIKEHGKGSRISIIREIREKFNGDMKAFKEYISSK